MNEYGGRGSVTHKPPSQTMYVLLSQSCFNLIMATSYITESSSRAPSLVPLIRVMKFHLIPPLPPHTLNGSTIAFQRMSLSSSDRRRPKPFENGGLQRGLPPSPTMIGLGGRGNRNPFSQPIKSCVFAAIAPLCLTEPRTRLLSSSSVC